MDTKKISSRGGYLSLQCPNAESTIWRGRMVLHFRGSKYGTSQILKILTWFLGLEVLRIRGWSWTHWQRLEQFKNTKIKMESTKKTKISIWIVISYISSCSYMFLDLGSVLCMLECFTFMNSLLLICIWWVSGLWCCTTFHCYLSRMKLLCWHNVLVEMEGIYKVTMCI